MVIHSDGLRSCMRNSYFNAARNAIMRPAP
jgi:hypothetical protein